MKAIAVIAFTLFSSIAFAGGWTSIGAVENVEIVRSQGFLIKGDIGDAASCGEAGYLWVAIDHPQYDQLYSMVLAAFMSGKRIHAFAHTCTEIGWHGGSFSTLNGSGALYIKH